MKIIRILPGIYNEADILEENLLFYIRQGIKTAVIDNGSTDGSYEICKKFAGKGIIKLRRIITAQFDTAKLMKEANRLCYELKPNWIILADADEFIEPHKNHKNLVQAIKHEDTNGYNLIKVNNFIFKMTMKDDLHEKSKLKRMKYYILGQDLARFKIWKSGADTFLLTPHGPYFGWQDDIKVSPNIFAMRHYPFRSLEQARRKISRVRPSETNPFGWNIHYLHLKNGINKQNLYSRISDLTKYNEDGCWNTKKIASEVKVSRKDLNQYLLKHFDSDVLEKQIKMSSNWQSNSDLITILFNAYLKDKKYDKANRECKNLLGNTKNIQQILLKKSKRIKNLLKK